MDYYEKTLTKETVYEGNIIDVELQTVELPNGKESKRDIVKHPGAAVIIPVNDNGEVYMVKQFRKPIERVLIELPAGKLDAGEMPEECAKRELKEETGLVAGSLKYITSIHTTPGFSNEVLHIFIARDLKEGDACADEDEFISTEKIMLDKLVNMIFNNELSDAKSITGILLAEKIIRGEKII